MREKIRRNSQLTSFLCSTLLELDTIVKSGGLSRLISVQLSLGQENFGQAIKKNESSSSTQ